MVRRGRQLGTESCGSDSAAGGADGAEEAGEADGADDAGGADEADDAGGADEADLADEARRRLRGAGSGAAGRSP